MKPISIYNTSRELRYLPEEYSLLFIPTLRSKPKVLFTRGKRITLPKNSSSLWALLLRNINLLLHRVILYKTDINSFLKQWYYIKWEARAGGHEWTSTATARAPAEVLLLWQWQILWQWEALYKKTAGSETSRLPLMTQWWMSWEYWKNHHKETDETFGQLHPGTKKCLV